MASISLTDFEDTLDPLVLDSGKQFLHSGKLQHITVEEDNFWTADYELDGEPSAVALEITRGKVSYAECSCLEFNEEAWAEEPCLHVVALLYGVIGKLTEQASTTPKQKPGPKKPAAKPAKKVPARKSDPAETLLGELEPKEIYDFVRQLIAKNKEFKSLFLLHFSERTGGNEQKFDDIVSQAIAAVKGRRKHLKGADGAKIASALTPLYKQAANGEAKGFFREAFLICQTFLHYFPPVFAALDTPSTKLETLFNNTLDLISLIIHNPGSPFEFRDELLESLLREFENLDKNFHGNIKDMVFKRVVEAARVSKRLHDVAGVLRKTVQHYKAMGKKSSWSEEYYAEIKAIERLVGFYETEMKSPEKALETLEENKDHLNFYLRLIELKTASGDYDTAIRYIEDIKKNIRKYKQEWSNWQLEKRLNELLLETYTKRGDQSAIGPLAARLFEESMHQDFKYYELEKSVTDPAKWPARVEKYLKATKPGQYRALMMTSSYFEILTREKRWTWLRDELMQVNSLMTWEKYGEPVRRHFPAIYLEQLQKKIEQEIKTPYTPHLPVVVNLLNLMAHTEDGAPVVRDMLARLRQQNAGRRELMRALEKVRVP